MLELLACVALLAVFGLFLASFVACLWNRDDRPPHVRRGTAGRALAQRQADLAEARNLIEALLQENRRLWTVIGAMLAQWHQEQEARAQWEVIGDGR